MFCAFRFRATDGTVAESYNNLANLYRDLGNDTEAVRMYKQALVVRPGYGAALGNLGTVYVRVKPGWDG